MAPVSTSADANRGPSRTERIEALEAAVADLSSELQQLRAEHEALAARLSDLLG